MRMLQAKVVEPKHTFRLLCRLPQDAQNGTARQATDDNVIWRMRITCWIPKATNTHSEHVIRIPFPLQQWLH